VPWATAERGRPVCKLHGLPKRIYGDAFVHNPKLFLDRNFTVGCWFAATGTLYAATGLALMHRAALARGFVASARVGECEEKIEILDKHRTLRLAPEPHTLDLYGFG
jgi:hypothetical protein